MSNLTTRGSEVTSEYSSFYDRDLLERALPYFLHTRYAEIRDIPGGFGTDTIKFRKYARLTAQTTPLTEGVTPTGKQLSITDITAQVQYYGDYVTLTDKLTIETADMIVTETNEMLGEQVGDSLDQLMRDVMHAGTNVQRASTAVNRSDITTAMVFNNDEAQEAVLTLKLNNAKPVMQMVDPSTDYNTIPLKPSFIGIMHPRTTKNAESDSAWIPVEKYSKHMGVMDNEVGAFPYVRFVETTNAKVFEGEGSGSGDVYSTVIFGRKAFARTRISTLTLKNIVKPLGSGGTTDPLDQRSTIGWKLSFVGKILYQEYVVRVEHGVN